MELDQKIMDQAAIELDGIIPELKQGKIGNEKAEAYNKDYWAEAGLASDQKWE
jgi:hypothetical protein